MSERLQEEPCCQLQSRGSETGSGMEVPTVSLSPGPTGPVCGPKVRILVCTPLALLGAGLVQESLQRGRWRRGRHLPPARQPPHFGFQVCRWWCHAQVTASSGNRTRDVGMRSPHPSLLPETPTPPPGNQAGGLHLHKAEWPWPEPEGPRPWTPSWSAHVQRTSRGAAGSLSAPARCPPGRTTSDQGSQGRPASSPAVRLYAEDRQ